jgi:Branched-chain amino acid transport system / permease component
VAAVVAWVLKRTLLGYSVRAVGDNPAAARVGGIALGRVAVAALAISGGIAGLRLDPFNVTNGPDLYVYLSTEPAHSCTRAVRSKSRGLRATWAARTTTCPPTWTSAVSGQW